MRSLSAIEFSTDLSNMATATELTTTVAKLEERVANHIKFFWIVVSGGAVWLAALSIALYDLNGTANDIKNRQTLAGIAAQLASLRTNDKFTNQNTVQEINAASRTVRSAIGKHPQYPETWEAASTLVNLRSQRPGESDIPQDIAAKAGPTIPNQGNCFNVPLVSKLGPMPPELRNHLWIVAIPLHDCTLYLDDLKGFMDSTIVKYLNQVAGNNYEAGFLDLTLVRVTVVYRGGEIIPVQRVTFYDCSFDFNVPSTPPKRAMDLLEAFVSKDFEEKNLKIFVPTA